MKNISKTILASAVVLSVLFVGLKAEAQTSATSAVLNASVNPGGMQTTAWFEYGTNPNLNTWTETQHESIGAYDYARTFSQTIYNLQPYTTYYFRVATNNGYNTYRAQILSFTTGTNNTNNQVTYSNTPNTVNVTRYVVNETKYVDRVLTPQTVYTTGTQPMYYQQPVSYQPVSYQYQPVAYQPVTYQPVTTNVMYQPANQVVAYQQPTYQPQISATTYKPAATTYTTQSATALAATPVFGANFLPNSVFDWLVLIALIFAVVLVARRLARA